MEAWQKKHNKERMTLEELTQSSADSIARIKH